MPTHSKSLEDMMRRLSLGSTPTRQDTASNKPIEFSALVELIVKLKSLVADAASAKRKARVIAAAEIESLFQQIINYQNHPALVLDAGNHGGVAHLFQRAQPLITKTVHFIERHHDKNYTPLNAKQAYVAASGFMLLARAIKTKQAYQRIRTGSKFLRAKAVAPLERNKSLASQDKPNPIELLSKQNIRRLIQEIGKLTDDEKYLMRLLMQSTPFQAQHATPCAYPITNTGSLDSLYERTRHDKTLKSVFSTPGNIHKLGNDSFVFFRCYVDGENGQATRYGDSKFILPLTAFEQQGWISLRDQLIPVRKGQNNKSLWDGKLLRQVEVVPLKTTVPSQKNMHDGLKYTYTSNKLFQASKTQNTPLMPKCRTCSFSEEIFYGRQIKLGLALSMIRELRYCRTNGFHDYFYAQLGQADLAKQIQSIGKLLRCLFRVEAKFPVAVTLKASNKQKQAHSIVTGMAPYPITLNNPAGNNAFDITGQSIFVKTYIAKIAQEIEAKKHQVRYDPVCQEQVKVLKALQQRIQARQHDEDEEDLIEKIMLIGKAFMPLVAYDPADYIDALTKFELEKLHVMADYAIVDGLCDNLIEIDELHNLSVVELTLLSEHFDSITAELGGDYDLTDLLAVADSLQQYPQVFQLFEEEFCTLTELSTLDDEELIALDSTEALTLAFQEHGQTLASLLALYRQDHWHLTCLTTDDITDLVLQQMPDVPQVLLDYALERDVDFDWLQAQCCESEQILFRMNHGLD